MHVHYLVYSSSCFPLQYAIASMTYINICASGVDIKPMPHVHVAIHVNDSTLFI